MAKRPGEISANTLSLRFMQNAAKAKRGEEMEAARAEVKSQEEWEISPSLRHSLGINDGASEEQRTVTYEQSYLPFLFPVLSNAYAGRVARSSSGNQARVPEVDDPDSEVAPLVVMRGRRTFGKHGHEEATESPLPEPSSSISGFLSLPRGVRAISSHGHAAVSFSASSNLPNAKLTPPLELEPVRMEANPKSLATQDPQTFMKPQVDNPRADNRDHTKRGTAYMSSLEDGPGTRKKRRHKDV